MIALLLFLILNFLLFLPRYFLNRETSTFFPYKEFLVNGKIRIAPTIVRFNDDVFRINLEYTILVFLFLLFKIYIPIDFAKILLCVVYFFTLILFYYHYAIYSIYKTYPAISNDIKLIQQGIKIGYSGFKRLFFLGIILFVCFLTSLFFLNSYLIALIYEYQSVELFIFGILLFIASLGFGYIKKINPFRFDKEFDFHYLLYFSVQITTFLINSNRFFNKKAKKDIVEIPKIIKNSIIEIPKNITLKHKPNIYFIAIESYGAILYENEIYIEKYKSLTQQITKNLTKKNWKVASSLATSNVTGGKSWVAYSSFLKGVAIKSDSIYRHLIVNQSRYKTQSIFEILEEFRYTNYLVSGLGGFENYKIEWESILQFLGTEKVIKFKDLEYNGVTFNFGPSAPDQYLLNKSLQLMKEKNGDKPFSFFVETINSHYKFDSPTKIFENWEDCNEALLENFEPIKNLSSNQIDNYYSAMEYQLKTVENLILNENSEAIFVIFGDHQPPILTNKDNSHKTPIHIISKNEAFINKWISRKFSESMFIDNFKITPELNHHDFKKHFVEIFLNTFKEN